MGAHVVPISFLPGHWLTFHLKRFTVTKTLLILLTTLLVSCRKPLAQEITERKPYFIYHINHDPEKDDDSFKLCNEQWVIPYYGGTKTTFQGDKPALINHFSSYNPPSNSKGQTGFVTIRFIVNCKGEAGRFRMETLSPTLEPTRFDKTITKQLLTLTQHLNGWVPVQHEGKPIDSYYYLCFQMRDGKIITITP
jgi:hypothetical protein